MKIWEITKTELAKMKIYAYFLIGFTFFSFSVSSQPSINKSYQDALREFEQQNYGQTQKILNYILKTDKTFADAYFLQGELHQAQHDERAAIDSYKNYNQHNRNNPKGFIKITEIYKKHNYRTLALLFLEEGLKRYPTNSAMLYTKASYLYESGHLDSAYKYLTKCIENSPNFDKAYNDRGVILHCQGKDNLATQDFATAILIDPKPLYYLNQGVNFYNLGQHQKAIQAYNQVIRSDSMNIYAYNLRGVIYMEQNNYPEAAADFLSAIDIDPEYSYPYNNLANLLTDKKDYLKAISLYNTAIELDNKSPEIYFNRGNIKELNTDRLEDACKDWERSVTLGMPRIVNYCP